ncbi:rCG59075 [Rattus norvegicus]|uniref:RCG59075 n=1 Tax=Rattus norvegicus TaxID=10116 RepID=A6JPK4_RAT|nr:rCG59075 [Rattus norvegicus]
MGATMWCWDLNLGSLEEQLVLLTTEQSFQPHPP